MMAFCAKGHLHICAPMIPGLPSSDEASAGQVWKTSGAWVKVPWHHRVAHLLQ